MMKPPGGNTDRPLLSRPDDISRLLSLVTPICRYPAGMGGCGNNASADPIYHLYGADRHVGGGVIAPK